MSWKVAYDFWLIVTKSHYDNILLTEDLISCGTRTYHYWEHVYINESYEESYKEWLQRMSI